jgi:hypothetical protein
MEPERQIEKLLRAFARKRRAGTGDAFKLHPVTRRRLQVEVEKQFTETGEEESVSLWQFFRQQWAFVTVFVMALFLGASLFMPALSKAKMKAKSVAAASHLRQIGTAAQMAAAENSGRLPATLDALTNGYLSGEVLKDPQSGKPFLYVAGGEALDELASNSVLAYSPETQKRRAVLLADGSVQLMGEDKFSQAEQAGLVGGSKKTELALNAPTPAAATEPAGTLAGYALATAKSSTSSAEESDLSGGRAAAPDSPALAANTARLADKEQKQLFKAKDEAAVQSGLNSNSQRFARNSREDKSEKAVLATFEVQQNGNALAVVDRDGSVYNGFLNQSDVVSKRVSGAPAEQLARTFSNQAAQNNYFSVTGLNRTLNQNVVFNGNFIQNSGNLSATNISQQMIFNNSGIAGTAIVGLTNEVRIEAEPVAP